MTAIVRRKPTVDRRYLRPTQVRDSAENVDALFGIDQISVDFSPYSRKAEQLEARIAGYDSFSDMLASFYTQKIGPGSTSPIPPRIMAQYRLSEYYFDTEGDLWQTISVPMDVGGRGLVVEHKDPATQQMWEDLYGEVEMEQIVEDAWQSLEIFGVACPFVYIDKRRSKSASVTLFDPKAVEIGHLPVGGWIGTLVGQPAADLQTIMDYFQTKKPLAYRGLNSQIDPMSPGAIPIDPTYMQIIRGQSLPWENYPKPPVRRSFRLLSTRQVLEEMVRATIEGFKNQLWLVTVGTRDMPALPGEIGKIRAQLQANRTERTGVLVTRGNVNIGVHAPNLDNVLSNEKFLELTYHLFRQRGVSLRIISGESARGSRDTLAIDVSVFVERMEAMRGRILDWIRHFNMQYLGTKNLHDPRLPSLRFKKTAIQIQNEIVSRLQPLLQMGLLSDRTALDEAGYDYSTELDHKQKEVKDRELFLPKPAFNQMTTQPGGVATETMSPSGGRPVGTKAESKPKRTAKQSVEASETEEDEG